MTVIAKLNCDVSEFRTLVAELSAGKRLPDAVYLHQEALAHAPPRLCAIVESVRVHASVGDRWNVLKLAGNDGKVSFLWYPQFFDEAFPTLAASTAVDLARGNISTRAYKDDNPPILHRKEMLLPPGHPRTTEARALTKAAEEVGLFDEPRDIGHRRAWEAVDGSRNPSRTDGPIDAPAGLIIRTVAAQPKLDPPLAAR